MYYSLPSLLKFLGGSVKHIVVIGLGVIFVICLVAFCLWYFDVGVQPIQVFLMFFIFFLGAGGYIIYVTFFESDNNKKSRHSEDLKLISQWVKETLGEDVTFESGLGKTRFFESVAKHFRAVSIRRRGGTDLIVWWCVEDKDVWDWMDNPDEVTALDPWHTFNPAILKKSAEDKKKYAVMPIKGEQEITGPENEFESAEKK